MKDMHQIFNKKQNTLQSLSDIQKMEMLEKLIQQLNKDLYLSGVDYQFSLNLSPRLLVEKMSKKITALMTNDFSKFTNLMYRIDISEKQLKNIEQSEFQLVVNKITFLVLKKEWQKVWFKNRNSIQE
jgi:hypothetical protein